MSVTVVNLIPRKQAENIQTGQYTALNCKAVIDKFTGTNTSGSDATMSVNLVASGGSASDSNLVVKTRTIKAGKTYTFPELVGQSLESGGFISTIASTSSAITISCTGREIVY